MAYKRLSTSDKINILCSALLYSRKEFALYYSDNSYSIFYPCGLYSWDVATYRERHNMIKLDNFEHEHDIYYYLWQMLIRHSDTKITIDNILLSGLIRAFKRERFIKKELGVNS